MLKKIVLVFAAVALAKAQIPSLGWCPDYVPMANFDMTRFMGVWYEAERYFQISELVSRCVTANYTRGIDGKYRVSNEVVNRFTGIKRVLEGEIKAPASKSEEGKLQIKYTTVPLAPETHYSVLETDYKNYAVLWACTGIGPVHAQNAWLMTRQRVPSGETLQLAYGVLDKYKIWKVPFVKTDQNECAQASELPAQAAVAPAPVAAPAPAPAAATVAAPAPAYETAAPVKEPVLPEPTVAARKTAENVHLRSSPILEEAEAVDETRAEEVAIELADAPVKPTPEVSEPVDQLREANAEPAAVLLPEEKPAVEIKAQEVEFKAIAPETIPEVILKVAESAKEAAAEPSAAVAEEPQLSAEPIPEESQTVEVAVPAEPEIKLVEDVQSPAVDPPKIVQAEEPPAEELKPETAPIEAPKPSEGAVKLAEEPKPAEILLASVPAEESQPLEPLPILRSPIVAEIEEPTVETEKIESPAPVVLLKSTEGIVSDGALEIQVVEIPAAVESPADSVLVKTLAEPEPEQSEVVILESAAEPAKLPEGEQLLKEAVLVALPETILEPVVPEAPETPEAPVAAAQPLKAAEAAPEESKVEVIAEVPKTLEAKP